MLTIKVKGKLYIFYTVSQFGCMVLVNGNMFLVNGKPFINKSYISCGFFKYA